MRRGFVFVCSAERALRQHGRECLVFVEDEGARAGLDADEGICRLQLGLQRRSSGRGGHFGNGRVADQLDAGTCIRPCSLQHLLGSLAACCLVDGARSGAFECVEPALRPGAAECHQCGNE